MTKDSSCQHQRKSRTLDTYSSSCCQRIITKRYAMFLHHTRGNTITRLRFIQEYRRQLINTAWTSFRAAGKEMKHFFNALQMEKVEHTLCECRR